MANNKRLPKLGEVVHFNPDKNDLIVKLTKSPEPMAAVVTKVHGEDLVNLTVFADGRPPQYRTSVAHESTNKKVSNYTYADEDE